MNIKIKRKTASISLSIASLLQSSIVCVMIQLHQNVQAIGFVFLLMTITTLLSVYFYLASSHGK